MNNTIELSQTAYQWLLRHPFMSEEKIIGIVQQTPESERKYIDDTHFEISFKTRSNSHILEIIIWTHERLTTYFVYKIHSQKVCVS